MVLPVDNRSTGHYTRDGILNTSYNLDRAIENDPRLTNRYVVKGASEESNTGKTKNSSKEKGAIWRHPEAAADVPAHGIVQSGVRPDTFEPLIVDSEGSSGAPMAMPYASPADAGNCAAAGQMEGGDPLQEHFFEGIRTDAETLDEKTRDIHRYLEKAAEQFKDSSMSQSELYETMKAIEEDVRKLLDGMHEVYTSIMDRLKSIKYDRKSIGNMNSQYKEVIDSSEDAALRIGYGLLSKAHNYPGETDQPVSGLDDIVAISGKDICSGMQALKDAIYDYTDWISDVLEHGLGEGGVGMYSLVDDDYLPPPVRSYCNVQAYIPETKGLNQDFCI